MMKEKKERLQKHFEEIEDRLIFTNDDKINEKIFSINFTITDPVIANFILLNLLNNKLKDVDLGIDIKSINLKPFTNIDKTELKIKLNEFIDNFL